MLHGDICPALETDFKHGGRYQHLIFQLWLTHIFSLVVKSKNEAKSKGKERENVGSAREDYQVVQVVKNDGLLKKRWSFGFFPCALLDSAISEYI